MACFPLSKESRRAHGRCFWSSQLVSKQLLTKRTEANLNCSPCKSTIRELSSIWKYKANKKQIYISHLRAQLCVLQSCFSSFGPSSLHFFPLPIGSGLLHLRVLVRVPPWQVLVQVLRELHFPYPLSTRLKKKKKDDVQNGIKSQQCAMVSLTPPYPCDESNWTLDWMLDHHH